MPHPAPDRPTQRSLIAEFLRGRRIAIVGVSRNGNAFQNRVMSTFEDSGYVVVPVNPAMTMLKREGQTPVPVMPTVRQIVGPLDGVLIMVPPDEAVWVMRDCIARRAPVVWLHRGGGRGSVSAAAIAEGTAGGVRVIEGGCPLMYLEPVTGIHRLHRGLHELSHPS